jgi:hypothetical protein
MKFCIIPDCDNLVEGRTDYCASHNHELRKAERQAKKVQIVKPVRKITAKRSKENQEYLKLRDEYLIAYTACEVEDCHNKSTQIHHMKGRENDLLLDVKYFLAVCFDCHEKITKDSNWAISKGYSILRTV